MRSLWDLFRRPVRVEIDLNARLLPLDRGDRFEDPLMVVLEKHFPGSEVTGAGTMLQTNGEPQSSDISIEIKGNRAKARVLLLQTLEKLGIPKGSTLHVDGERIRIGTVEGVALYLNGTDLPDDVYRDNDVNDLIAELEQVLTGEGELYSYWQGPSETALYCYGPSAQRMRERIESLTETHPLAQRSRIVDLTSSEVRPLTGHTPP